MRKTRRRDGKETALRGVGQVGKGRRRERKRRERSPLEATTGDAEGEGAERGQAVLQVGGKAWEKAVDMGERRHGAQEEGGWARPRKQGTRDRAGPQSG